MTDQRRSMLVVDDEQSICLAFRRFFDSRGWVVHTAASAGEGVATCGELRPDIVFLDVRLPDQSGLDVLGDLARCGAHIIVITAYGGLDTVVRALHGKACEYLVKPIDLDEALSLVERVMKPESARSGSKCRDATAGESLVGRSSAMQNVYKLIARAARTSSPVLIHGETGTGKELASLAIHRFGGRKDGPFCAINCGAIPEHLIESELFGHVRGAFTDARSDRTGKFESADGGTLLLDEVGELPPPVQVKLLRVLDSGAIERVGSSQTVQLDVRILAATNKDLEVRVRSGLFRRDLYYRLAVLQISIPPLRERADDIPRLAEHFLRELSAERGDGPHSLSADALDALMKHRWAGNVRELKNALHHAVAVAPGSIIRADDLPESIVRSELLSEKDADELRDSAVRYASSLPDGETGRYRETLEHVESALIAHAMDRYEGNQSEAAEHLGIHRNTLRKKLREFRLHPEDDPQENHADIVEAP